MYRLEHSLYRCTDLRGGVIVAWRYHPALHYRLGYVESITTAERCLSGNNPELRRVFRGTHAPLRRLEPLRAASIAGATECAPGTRPVPASLQAGSTGSRSAGNGTAPAPPAAGAASGCA